MNYKEVSPELIKQSTDLFTACGRNLVSQERQITQQRERWKELLGEHYRVTPFVFSFGPFFSFTYLTKMYQDLQTIHLTPLLLSLVENFPFPQNYQEIPKKDILLMNRPSFYQKLVTDLGDPYKKFMAAVGDDYDEVQLFLSGYPCHLCGECVDCQKLMILRNYFMSRVGIKVFHSMRVICVRPPLYLLFSYYSS